MLNALSTLLAFIFTLGVIVTIHEYGHFQVAKWCDVKVLKFSIGFGKPFFSRKFGRDQTEFILAAIPLGGYVKLLNELEPIEAEDGVTHDMSRALNRQSIPKRMAIVLAGSAANLLLAIVLYWFIFMMGIVGLKPTIGKVVDHSPAAMASLTFGETIQKINGKEVATWQEARWILLKESLKGSSYHNTVEIQAINNNQEIHIHQLNLSNLDNNPENVDKNSGDKDNFDVDILDKLGLTIYQPSVPALIGDITSGSPAELAGLKTNDLVLEINNTKVSYWEEFVEVIRQNPGKPLNVLVNRNNEQLKLLLTPESANENNKVVGKVGAAYKLAQHEQDKLFITLHYSVFGAFAEATEKTWDTAIFSLKMIGNMLIGNVSWKGMSGPVTIASYAGQSAHMGFKSFITFIALISISIGVMNLLPIPVLDGGHFMYYVTEVFTGKPVSEATMIIGQKIGFILLGFMMILALFNDTTRLING